MSQLIDRLTRAVDAAISDESDERPLAEIERANRLRAQLSRDLISVENISVPTPEAGPPTTTDLKNEIFRETVKLDVATTFVTRAMTDESLGECSRNLLEKRDDLVSKVLQLQRDVRALEAEINLVDEARTTAAVSNRRAWAHIRETEDVLDFGDDNDGEEDEEGEWKRRIALRHDAVSALFRALVLESGVDWSSSPSLVDVVTSTNSVV